MIHARNLGVRFLFDRHGRLVTPTLVRLRRGGAGTWGIRDVTVTIERGEGVALMGPTGSGKTTFLRTIAAVLPADAGVLDVRGRVGTLLATDAGLMHMLTGRENALLLAVLAGLPRRDALRSLETVKMRSGLGEDFERPVASFSQGMRARLGFAVADQVDADILVLDEVHEALDHEFRDVVEQRVRERLAAGGIVVAAGHDHSMLERLCGRALLFADGRIERDGQFEEVQRAYLS